MAADLIDEFPGGIWFVQLALLSNPALVPQAEALALGVHEQPGRSLAEVLIQYMRARRLLLILDNCEHLVEMCACFAAELLQNVPNHNILATSHMFLNVPGETNYPVHPLTLPDRSLSLPAKEYP